MSTRDLLFEIGVEELPSSFVAQALAALPTLVSKRFGELRVAHGAVTPYGTPRRLSVLVREVSESQADLSEHLVGPPATAAFDKQGKPTRAAEAFAQKLGCAVTELQTVETPKGKYLAGTRQEKGKPTTELLGAALAEIVTEIPFRKSMRWGEGEATFGRPIQWLVALYGSDRVDLTAAGVRSGRASRGHRFLSPGPVELRKPSEYVDAMRAAHVLVDPAERAKVMRDRLAAAAREAGGTLIEDDFLVGENLSLVEEPHVVVGSFEAAYLSLPEAVILEVAKGHQRYFGMRGPDGRLLPKYLAVVNTAQNEANVRRGNDRAMRPRLADARFFYEEDRKIPLEARREKLAGIVFQNRLGHMLAKSDRVERLARELGALLGLPAAAVETAARGAHIAKCDLVSLMVGEFPELQGVMGREYALAQGIDPAVADVIRDHYAPKGAHDPTATSDPAALVAIADRLDTLVGCFAVGLSPTGAADPFALRRAAIGTLRTLLDRGYDLSLTAAFQRAHGGLAGIKLDLDEDALVAKLSEFVKERLRGLLEADAPADVVDACLAASFDRPIDTRARARALKELPNEVRARAGEVFKRASNIGKDAPAGPPVAPNETLATPHPSEVALFAAFTELGRRLDAAAKGAKWPEAFAAVSSFAPALHQFFTDVFVMVDDVKVRDNRLRLMRAISTRCSALAHFQLLGAAPGG
jgi:glycyl-tRNA synthetase beta chain